MDAIPVDPKLNYLVMELVPSSDDMVGRDDTPAVIVPLTTDFFQWVDERRGVVEGGFKLQLAHAAFHHYMDVADLCVFNPESYSPDGEEDEEPTKAMQVMLAPIWAELEANRFAVVSGKTLQDCGLDPLEPLDGFRLVNEYFVLAMTSVYEKPAQLVFSVETELKHSYDAWNSMHINYEDMRAKYHESALAAFTVKPG